ncbi:hypothetical protein [Rhodococcus sp. ACPA1]|uniref:hypothetical protein n=1 Tax=Rhodococcus sp. ACPA1 TaxID=2028572 RepID=UPI000BB13765|nr:hypothetical protein [Rhodococcus sp. ACPA1]PBC54897.1 hypothetical protein CJ177_17965 [Rhodococcus sp. ACPA1]
MSHTPAQRHDRQQLMNEWLRRNPGTGSVPQTVLDDIDAIVDTLAGSAHTRLLDEWLAANPDVEAVPREVLLEVHTAAAAEVEAQLG